MAPTMKTLIVIIGAFLQLHDAKHRPRLAALLHDIPADHVLNCIATLRRTPLNEQEGLLQNMVDKTVIFLFCHSHSAERRQHLTALLQRWSAKELTKRIEILRQWPPDEHETILTKWVNRALIGNFLSCHDADLRQELATLLKPLIDQWPADHLDYFLGMLCGVETKERGSRIVATLNQLELGRFVARSTAPPQKNPGCLWCSSNTFAIAQVSLAENGKTLPCLIDTGANISSVRRSFLKDAGIDFKEIRLAERFSINGAGGSIYSSSYTELDLFFRGFYGLVPMTGTFKSVFYILEPDGGPGLIVGTDILGREEISLDFTASCLVMRHCKGIKIPMTIGSTDGVEKKPDI